MKTKKCVLLLTFLGFTTFLCGQNFISENNQWNVRYEINWGGYGTEIYRMSGDSVLGNKSYKKIYGTFDTALVTWNLRGLVRADSNKIYFVKEFSTSEGLLYDFNLKEGDTSYIINYWCTDPQLIVCQSIDSILLNNGNYRKRWNLGSSSEEQWIDGIGSTKGPLFSYHYYCVSDLYYSLLCFHENGTLYFMNSSASSCYETNVGVNNVNSGNHFIISPNPVIKGQPITINSDLYLEKIEILNLEGRLLKRYSKMQAAPMLINVNDLDVGIYIMKIKCSNSVCYTYKIAII